MSIQDLRARLPDHARDLRLNLDSVLSTSSLGEQQLWGTALASAIAARNPDVLRAVEAEARQHLSPEAERAARGAAAVMAMNNVYYRFLHLVENDEYGRLPARLRMQALASRDADKLDIELWSLAVSAINGCGSCVDSHERAVRKGGVSAQQVQDAIRVAAVIQAVAVTLDAEIAAGAEAAAA